MKGNTNKKHKLYHELDNNEEFEFIESAKKLERKNSDIKSAELPPKIHHKNSESTNANADSKKEFYFKHSISTERIKDLRKFNSFSPKSYKRTYIGEGGTREQLISLENNIKEFTGLLKEKGKNTIEKQAISEKNLIEKLKMDINIEKNEEMMIRLKDLFEILQKINSEEPSNVHDILNEIIAKKLENNMNKDIAAMLTGDSVIEMEQNDNINALRESFHEFSLKKLMQMSFVEKRKALNLNNNLNPLSVDTNSLKKPALIRNINKNVEKKYDDDSFCGILQNNLWLLICTFLISALIFIILIM